MGTKPKAKVTTTKPSTKKIASGPRGDGTLFKKCGGGFLKSAKDRCYEVVVSKLKVQMGNDGTDDAVRVKICSDVNQKNPVCCVTDILKTSRSDDWSKNGLETWNKDVLGSCKGKKLPVKQSLNATIQKNGKDSLKVTSIILETEGITAKADKTTLEQLLFLKVNSQSLVQKLLSADQFLT